MARELVSVMRRDVRTDWTVRDDVRAKLRSSIKRLLVKHGYPPDKQPAAIKLVLEQMESIAPRYAADRTCAVPQIAKGIHAGRLVLVVQKDGLAEFSRADLG
ncbi:MAG: type I restriction enzyme endonuclease domain-containing protein [Pseudonocardiaceae bacterium]